ncbi:MAG TPA: hypothetical protein VFQ25_01195 [Ktedonobacterales bacterium]|nr:hypothetical protein [Ktedonobacterales bacterium]
MDSAPGAPTSAISSSDAGDPERPRASGGRIAIISAMIFAALLIIAYWAIWYGGGRDLLASSHAASYYTFENAFPAADGWLALTLLLGALGLALNRPWALLWGLLAGGAGLYLGCMDVLFDIENGIYLVPKGGDPSAVAIEIAINVLTFALSAVALTYLWRQRRSLLSQS